jgi:hypothetical protein
MQEPNTGKHFSNCNLYTLAGPKKNKKDRNVENNRPTSTSYL